MEGIVGVAGIAFREVGGIHSLAVGGGGHTGLTSDVDQLASTAGGTRD